MITSRNGHSTLLEVTKVPHTGLQSRNDLPYSPLSLANLHESPVHLPQSTHKILVLLISRQAPCLVNKHASFELIPPHTSHLVFVEQTDIELRTGTYTYPYLFNCRCRLTYHIWELCYRTSTFETSYICSTPNVLSAWRYLKKKESVL